MTLSVGEISKMFGISRTTLLYYDKIGLLYPEARNASGYRLYSQADVERLKQIITLKNAGVPIKQISSLIATDETMVFGKLIKRLGELNMEIEQLKNNQKQIVNLLRKTLTVKYLRNSDSTTIDKIISYAEIDLDKKDQWHLEFEAQSPELHEYFLSVLGLSKAEIKALKNRIKSNTAYIPSKEKT